MDLSFTKILFPSDGNLPQNLWYRAPVDMVSEGWARGGGGDLGTFTVKYSKQHDTFSHVATQTADCIWILYHSCSLAIHLQPHYPFYAYFTIKERQQTVQSMIRCRNKRHLIRVYTIRIRQMAISP